MSPLLIQTRSFSSIKKRNCWHLKPAGNPKHQRKHHNNNNNNNNKYTYKYKYKWQWWFETWRIMITTTNAGMKPTKCLMLWHTLKHRFCPEEKPGFTPLVSLQLAKETHQIIYCICVTTLKSFNVCLHCQSWVPANTTYF